MWWMGVEWANNYLYLQRTEREVSKLLELEKGKTTKVIWKYSKLSITEAQDTSKHSLKVPTASLKSYTRDVEAQRNHRM